MFSENIKHYVHIEINWQGNQQQEAGQEAAGLEGLLTSYRSEELHQLRSLGVDFLFEMFEQEIRKWLEEPRESG